MEIDLIEFKLLQSGKPLIILTEQTIQRAEFITTKVHDYREKTRDVELCLKFENSSICYRTPTNNSCDDEHDEDTELKPDEIDSVRSLLKFSVVSDKTQIAYLDGEVKIGNGIEQVTHFSYKNLFVLKCTEEYSEATRRYTNINIVMREKAR